jgi:hypothetical protein
MTLQNVVTSCTNQQQTQSLDQHNIRSEQTSQVPSVVETAAICAILDGSGGCGSFWKTEPEQNIALE